MDRRKALEQLEVVRPDSDDLNDAKLAEAVASLEDDAQARQEFDRRLELDTKIAAVMQSVPVPEGLKAKLIAATTAQPASASAKKNSRRSNRRVALIAGMSLCLLAAAGILLLPGQTRISHDDIVQNAPRNTDEIVSLASASSESTADVGFELPPWLARKKIQPQLAWPSENSPLPSGQNKATSLVLGSRNWVLVVTPIDRLKEPLEPGAAGTIGGALPNTGHYHGAWQDQQFAYVLFVKGDRRTYDRVRSNLAGPTA